MTPELNPDEFVDFLNRTYAALHTKKEDIFWRSYMGLDADVENTRKELGNASAEVDRWLQDPERLTAVKSFLAKVEASEVEISDEGRLALEGWSKTFEAQAIESAAGRRLSEELIELESKLALARSKMQLGYQVAGEEWKQASSIELGGMLRSDPSPERRKAAWEALRSIEMHVLKNGFLDVVRERNRLGRMLGGEDYYDWKTRRVEGMPKAEIFELLDELEERTRDSGARALSALKARHGSDVTPWNIGYLVSGDVTRELDPYFPFALSFERWVRTFAGLGADYRNARLVLDLLDRPGKYENGFCHWPEVAWTDRGTFIPERAHFTANAIPKQIGAGQRALETLFHEGGHAIHFANIPLPAPCFSQEYAPTSVAYSEIQSMLLDSIAADPDWLYLYATTRDGARMPFALIEKMIEAKQPFAAWSQRLMLVVPYAERAIYEIPDDELTAENVLRTIRDVEFRILGLEEGSPRPVLSVPHPLARESSAYYHGYVLAEMGVEQTKAFLIAEEGYIVDNPRVCPRLKSKYWEHGNLFGLHENLRRMTGSPLSARHLADRVNRSYEDTVERARAAYLRVEGKSPYNGSLDLNASIAVVHGNESIVDTRTEPIEVCVEKFRVWIDGLPLDE